MNKQEYLKSLQVGDVVTRFFHGAGFITQGEEAEIVHLTETHIWVDEKMEDVSSYDTKSIYAYSRITGKCMDSSFGMFHTIELPNAKAPN